MFKILQFIHTFKCLVEYLKTDNGTGLNSSLVSVLPRTNHDKFFYLADLHLHVFCFLVSPHQLLLVRHSVFFIFLLCLWQTQQPPVFPEQKKQHKTSLPLLLCFYIKPNLTTGNKGVAC